MGFTAPMEDFDEARFTQGPLPADGRPERPGGPTIPLRRDEDRHEELVGSSGQLGVRVSAGSADGQEALRAEMHLLASLEVAGLAAAPTVLTLEDDGYVRESAHPLGHRRGRRAAGNPSPATAERAALGRARDDLDALVDALHERDWVLGAPPGEGLGMRADGSVVLLDLGGLRPGQALADRRADRHWVDSVLHDEERTLRRRVHEAEPRTEKELEGPTHVASASSSATPLPAPRPTRSRPEHPAGPRPAVPGLMTSMREVVAQRGLRRTTALTAAAVLSLGVLLGTGTWLVLSPGHEHPKTPPAAASPTREGAPEITEPWALAAELAGARHAYVTGLSSRPAAAPGTPALSSDQQVRQAYQGSTVTGGGPVIHEARLRGGPDEEGLAVLEVTSSREEYEIEEADGTVRTVAASEPAVLELTLRWDGAQWLVTTTRTVSSPDAA
ncbi:hypothetical protein GCM10009626_04460 [Brachybacterium sacelli]